ncbi:cell division protein FtsX [Sphingomonas lenta]|uniref:Permease n=1 Tax=Sphingomonas lenta TaxID=1141887 RepID=A0A2A2SE49_9SPHN|nr:FtsX-like permease family protein [Sphingomonas lenta]PAX07519.1 permease [Sphingomonas lenta]
MSDRSQTRVLDEAGGFRAMTAVMGIMLFLTVLATALGLGTLGAARTLDRQLAGRLTVQVVDGDPAARDRAAARVTELLRRHPDVLRVDLVDRAELQRLIEPWLGASASSGALPVPALIDVDLRREDAAPRVADVVRRAASNARVDRHEEWMSPVSRFMDLLTALAAALVALMAAATLAVVVLAVRSGLEAHRGTIEVMHMLGSTDVQVARLFQRRIALDALLGGGVGGLAALAIVWLLGRQLGALGSELLGGATLGRGEWTALAAVPLLFILLATLAARRAVLADLKRTL